MASRASTQRRVLLASGKDKDRVDAIIERSMANKGELRAYLEGQFEFSGRRLVLCLPDVVRDVTVTDDLPSMGQLLPAGARVRCPDCLGIHNVVPCSSPNFPELLFVYCGGVPRLAAIDGKSFYEVFDHEDLG